MAPAVADRVWRTSTPQTVEEELAALWREVAQRGAVARAVMSNLVVFRFHERRTRGDRPVADTSNDPIEAVVALHPSRVIVLEHDRGEHGVREPMGAGVGVCLFGPPSARYGVEEIVVRSACADASFPSIVRRFLRGDLPTGVWWTEDLSQAPPLPALVDLGRQLVYDSRQWSDVDGGFRVVAPLARENRIDLADINWRRLAPLRRAMPHALAGILSNPRPRVRLSYRPGEAALASLLAGWMVARFRWSLAAISIAEQPDDAADLLTLAIGEGDSAVTAALDGTRLVVHEPGVAPMTLPAVRESNAEAIAAELRTLSRDSALRETIAALANRDVQSK
jgi:glucose-6-phosphate dehydrogenase assembly protein OpcA